jgi:hypothetical protein
MPNLPIQSAFTGCSFGRKATVARQLTTTIVGEAISQGSMYKSEYDMEDGQTRGVKQRVLREMRRNLRERKEERKELRPAERAKRVFDANVSMRAICVCRMGYWVGVS